MPSKSEQCTYHLSQIDVEAIIYTIRRESHLILSLPPNEKAREYSEQLKKIAKDLEEQLERHKTNDP